jgi:propanol-preferring alcohol dehydrogenase
MLALKLTGNSKVEKRDIPLPEVKPGWERVKVRAACICGSDMGIYQNGTLQTPGHEPAGEVDAVGAGVTKFAVGDRVSVNSLASCGACEHCRRGMTTFCRNLRGELGFSMDGGDAEYLLTTDTALYSIPDEISWIQAALMGDAIGTPYKALKRIDLHPEETIAVIGLGPIGLSAVSIASHMGAKVIGIDPNPYRRTLAESVGAFRCFDPDGSEAEQTIENCAVEGPNKVIDCSGAESTTSFGLDLIRPGGIMALVGEKRSVTINPSVQVIHKQVSIVGSFYSDMALYDEMTALIQSGLAPERIVTHQFPLECGDEAFRLFASGEAGKVVLTCG